MSGDNLITFATFETSLQTGSEPWAAVVLTWDGRERRAEAQSDGPLDMVEQTVAQVVRSAAQALPGQSRSGRTRSHCHRRRQAAPAV